MDGTREQGEADREHRVLGYDARWAAVTGRAEAVFRVLIADIGVDGWDNVLKSALQAIDEGFPGVSFEDGQGVLSRFALDISEDWVDFAHVDAEPGGIYALPLDRAQQIIEEIRALKSGGPTGG